MAGTGIIGRLRLDPFMAAILATVGLASVLPASGPVAGALGVAAKMAIAALFFLYGGRLSPRATLDALRHWRLHAVVFLTTFAVFPLLGLAAYAWLPSLLPTPVAVGVLYLCALPSTVQSSVAFTATARGNVAAAICSASLSSLLGIALTPLLVALLLGGGGGFSAGSAVDIVVQLLLPFLAGQAARPWIGRWLERNSRALGLYDRGSILLIVYMAFSEAVAGGIWQQIEVPQLGILLAAEAALLGAVLTATSVAARWLGFDAADRTTIMFCGSKKSMATGLPMAGVLFAGQSIGLLVLPLMLFHQMQLMVCAVLARRLARRRGAAEAAAKQAPGEQDEGQAEGGQSPVVGSSTANGAGSAIEPPNGTLTARR